MCGRDAGELGAEWEDGYREVFKEILIMAFKNDQVSEKETEKITELAREALALDGDYVEMGCYKGDTSLLLAEIIFFGPRPAGPSPRAAGANSRAAALRNAQKDNFQLMSIASSFMTPSKDYLKKPQRMRRCWGRILRQGN